MFSSGVSLASAGELLSDETSPPSECPVAQAEGAPEAAPAFAITGLEEIPSRGTYEYTVDVEGEVVWSAYGNFGTGGGVSQDGKLTLGADACGVVTVAASVDGATATKEVRVKDNGRFITVERCGAACYFWCPATPTCQYSIGSYRYTTGVKCCGPAGYTGEPCCHSGGCCEGYWSEEKCGMSGPCGDGTAMGFVRWSEKEKFVCRSCANNTNADGDGYTACGSPADCDDSYDKTYPGAPELCDGRDNDCDGEFDEECAGGDDDGGGSGGCEALTWYKDADGDGYSDGASLTQCERPEAYKLAEELNATSGDCEDDPAKGGPGIHPGAEEVCDGRDNNCNNKTDEGVIGSVSSNLTSVWPKETGGNDKAQVGISLKQKAGYGCEIELKVFEAESTGHEHGVRPTTRLGTVNDKNQTDVLIGVGKTAGLAMYNSNVVAGKEEIKYRVKRDAPAVTMAQSGDTLTVTGGSDEWDGALTIDVMVPGLEALPDGNDKYILTGNSGNTTVKACPGHKIEHATNHYGNPSAIKNIRLMAISYYYRTKKHKLRINDMSLPIGGIFDICSNWKPPHTMRYGHPVGLGVDIDTTARDSKSGQSVSVDRKQLKRIAAIYKGSPAPEASIHYTFPPY